MKESDINSAMKITKINATAIDPQQFNFYSNDLVVVLIVYGRVDEWMSRMTKQHSLSIVRLELSILSICHMFARFQA